MKNPWENIPLTAYENHMKRIIYQKQKWYTGVFSLLKSLFNYLYML